MRTSGPSSHQTIQRVKVGMVGLAAVILLIGLASALFSIRDRTDAVAVVNVTSNASNAVDPANEPLAELGVAPSADLNSTQTAGQR